MRFNSSLSLIYILIHNWYCLYNSCKKTTIRGVGKVFMGQSLAYHLDLATLLTSTLAGDLDPPIMADLANLGCFWPRRRTRPLTRYKEVKIIFLSSRSVDFKNIRFFSSFYLKQKEKEPYREAFDQ